MKPEKFKVKKLNNPTEKEIIDTINEIGKIINHLDITKPSIAKAKKEEFLRKRDERLNR